MTNYYKRLRDQLPRNYAAMISDRIPGVNARKVRAVFNGLVTNPEIVDSVIRVALKIRAKEEKRMLRLKTSIKSKKTNLKRAA